jgi:membrane-bound inhibitor of C-type lysozyme
MKKSRMTAALCLLPTISAAADMTIHLPTASSVMRSAVTYQCQGLPQFSVEYINAGSNALAVIPVAGEALVFANVLSGSGARYAAGPYVWWTKGRTAELYNQREGDAKPTACEEIRGG